MKMSTFHERVASHIEGGLVRAERHPTLPLTIYNYTAACQYRRAWDEVTLACRGLIVADDGQVVARPFAKFFNLSEHDSAEIPDEPFEVYEKLDGSLGILYWDGDTPRLATRGSFVSEQARAGTEILHRLYAGAIPHLDRRLTYLFEVLYPGNRIVVNYGDEERLVLLAVRETATGRDLPLEEHVHLGFPLPKRYDGLDYRTAYELDWENHEGFVVLFNSGFRAKVKLAEYTRLHRLITGVSALVIWEYLRDGRPLDELLEHVPDEFYRWVERVGRELQEQYAAVEAQCRAEFKDLGDRKANALYYQRCTYPHILFSMLDGKPYSRAIWQLIRPTAAQPFWTQAQEEG